MNREQYIAAMEAAQEKIMNAEIELAAIKDSYFLALSPVKLDDKIKRKSDEGTIRKGAIYQINSYTVHVWGGYSLICSRSTKSGKLSRTQYCISDTDIELP